MLGLLAAGIAEELVHEAVEAGGEAQPAGGDGQGSTAHASRQQAPPVVDQMYSVVARIVARAGCEMPAPIQAVLAAGTRVRVLEFRAHAAVDGSFRVRCEWRRSGGGGGRVEEGWLSPATPDGRPILQVLAGGGGAEQAV